MGFFLNFTPALIVRTADGETQQRPASFALLMVRARLAASAARLIVGSVLFCLLFRRQNGNEMRWQVLQQYIEALMYDDIERPLAITYQSREINSEAPCKEI
ncbi:unnamed protein product [Amoebophrya sp. A120]|nr:unnamed protein product [Amoebophrya sp. A120]|eukprot:GSA120T00012527001.1